MKREAKAARPARGRGPAQPEDEENDRPNHLAQRPDDPSEIEEFGSFDQDAYTSGDRSTGLSHELDIDRWARGRDEAASLSSSFMLTRAGPSCECRRPQREVRRCGWIPGCLDRGLRARPQRRQPDASANTASFTRLLVPIIGPGCRRLAAAAALPSGAPRRAVPARKFGGRDRSLVRGAPNLLSRGGWKMTTPIRQQPAQPVRSAEVMAASCCRSQSAPARSRSGSLGLGERLTAGPFRTSPADELRAWQGQSSIARSCSSARCSRDGCSSPTARRPRRSHRARRRSWRGRGG